MRDERLILRIEARLKEARSLPSGRASIPEDRLVSLKPVDPSPPKTSKDPWSKGAKASQKTLDWIEARKKEVGHRALRVVEGVSREGYGWLWPDLYSALNDGDIDRLEDMKERIGSMLIKAIRDGDQEFIDALHEASLSVMNARRRRSDQHQLFVRALEAILDLEEAGGPWKRDTIKEWILERHEEFAAIDRTAWKRLWDQLESEFPELS